MIVVGCFIHLICEDGDLFDLLETGFHEDPPGFIGHGDFEFLKSHEDGSSGNDLAREMDGGFCAINVIQESPGMLDDGIALFVFVERSNKATDISMGDVEKFVDFEAKFKEDLILSVENFLFHVVVFVGVEFELLDWANAFVHLKIGK